MKPPSVRVPVRRWGMIRAEPAPYSSSGESGLDPPAGAVGDHRHDRVWMAPRNLWHDGGINNPESLDATNTQLRIDNGITVCAHPAGAGWVIDGLEHLCEGFTKVVITGDRWPREDLGVEVGGKRR